MSAYISEAEPVFIVGCGRSGTTLLRMMLDMHRDICCGPETWLFLQDGEEGNPYERTYCAALSISLGIPFARLWEQNNSGISRAQIAESALSLFAEKEKKPRWAEKTPLHVHRIDYILTHFPKAKIVHILRDGRDVICSLVTHPKFIVDGAQQVAATG